jgi:hypothetical protein
VSLLGMFREPRIEMPRLTNLAQDEQLFPTCTIKAPGCIGFLRGGMVWCHSNLERHGKGKGLKAHDCFGAVGCPVCHTWVDTQRGPERDDVFERGRDRTLYILFLAGALKVNWKVKAVCP